MKTVCLKIAPVFGFMLCVISLHAQKNTNISTLKPDKFKALMEQTANPCLIDVRSSDADFNAGHIAGAIHLSSTDAAFVSELKKRYSETDILFIYCRMGKTSKAAARIIMANGFKHVYNLKGGVLAWEKRFPLVTGQ